MPNLIPKTFLSASLGLAKPQSVPVSTFFSYIKAPHASFPLVKGNKAIKHKWKSNFPFSNPVSCNNIVRSTERLVQSDEQSHRSLWRSKSSRMTYSCGSSQNPACTLALGQWNNFKETRHLSRNVGFWGLPAVMCGIFSLPAIYSQSRQLLVPIQNGLLIWAFICKESSVKRQRNCLLRGSQWSSTSQIWNLNSSVPICSEWL